MTSHGLGRSQSGAWDVLTWTLVFVLSAALLLLTLHGFSNEWRQGGYHPSVAGGPLPEQDLANLWMAGHLARLGRLDWLYTSRLFEAWRNLTFGEVLQPQPWIYPPTVLFIGVPLSFLPLVTAYVVWDAGTLLLAVIVLRNARLPWPILLVGLSAPATWFSLVLGQYGVIIGALTVASLLLATPRPGRAGIMLGLCALKPQQALTIPVACFAARNWRLLGAATAVSGAMIIVISVWFGSGAWDLFFTQAKSSTRALLEAPLPQPYVDTGVSVFWMARTLRCGMTASYYLQGAATLVVIALVYRAWRMPEAEPLARMAATVCLALLATPYGYTDDMVAYTVAVTVVIANNNWRVRPLDGLLWLWPGYCALVTVYTGVLLTPIAIVTTAALAWRQMSRKPIAAVMHGVAI